jgi:VanZ family protein
MSSEIVEEPPTGARALIPVREPAPTRLAATRNYPLLAAIGWTVLLLALILAPERVLPIESSTEVRHHRIRLDLVVHFILFLGFAVSWLRATRGRLRWVLVPAIGLFLAAGTELVQGISFIHRDPSLSDALADCAGLVAGTLWFRAGSLPSRHGA